MLSCILYLFVYIWVMSLLLLGRKVASRRLKISLPDLYNCNNSSFSCDWDVALRSRGLRSCSQYFWTDFPRQVFGSRGATGVVFVSRAQQLPHCQIRASFSRLQKGPTAGQSRAMKQCWVGLWESRLRKGKDCCTTAAGRGEWEMRENQPWRP